MSASTKESASTDAKKRRTVVELICPVCKRVFTREKRQTHLVKGGSHTFCSRACVGRGTGRGGFVFDEQEVLAEYETVL